MSLECINYTTEQLDMRAGTCASQLNCTVFDGNIPVRVHVSDKDKVEVTADTSTEVGPAPFVCPCEDFRGVDYQNAEVEWLLQPATIGLENQLHSCDLPLPQLPGERPWSQLDYRQRYNRHVGRLLTLQEQSRKQRMDLMKRDIILYGKSVIEQRDKNDKVVAQYMLDFDRDPRLTRRLVGPATWDHVDTADPLADLEAFEGVLIEAGGSNVGRFFIGRDVWKYLRENARVRKQTCATKCGRVPESFDWVPGNRRGVADRGELGSWRFITVNCQFRDENGDMRDLIPPNAVVAIGEGDCGPRLLELYGAVQQVNRKLPTQVFRWNEIDASPRKRWQKFGFESHPLIASLNPNGAAIMYVLPEGMR